LPSDKLPISAGLVRQLVTSQFPAWADLPIWPVELGGWDNVTFRLGRTMSVRLPSAAAYADQVEKEHRWLPRLAPLLPLPIPIPLARGRPDERYPHPWSVYRWLEGEPAAVAPVRDALEFASMLAGFLVALQRIDAAGGPPPGKHNFYRGGSLLVYDQESRQAIATLGDAIDGPAASRMWEQALDATCDGRPVWVHGDVATGNLLLRDGRLSAVIDFGCSAVGDPACDLVIAWTFLAGPSRERFRAALPLDEATWARGRGWALWKALITLAEHIGRNPALANAARQVIDELLADPL
jgi:aminoglycoside phosphotransferase (APT) family kinase protein